MSILQEYEEHYKYIGRDKINAIDDYILYMEKKGTELFYSDIVYKRAEWDKFEKWYNKKYGKSARRNKTVQR